MWALTESQEILRASVQRLLENEYSFEQRRESLGAATGYALPVWERFAELGLTGLTFAEAWGGFGGTDIDVAIVMRELGAGLVVAPYLPTPLSWELPLVSVPCPQLIVAPARPISSVGSSGVGNMTLGFSGLFGYESI